MLSASGVYNENTEYKLHCVRYGSLPGTTCVGKHDFRAAACVVCTQKLRCISRGRGLEAHFLTWLRSTFGHLAMGNHCALYTHCPCVIDLLVQWD